MGVDQSNIRNVQILRLNEWVLRVLELLIVEKSFDSICDFGWEGCNVDSIRLFDQCMRDVSMPPAAIFFEHFHCNVHLTHPTLSCFVYYILKYLI